MSSNMSISQLLTNLEELNIQIDILDDQLKIKAPEGILTPVLINELKTKKQDIINFFRERVQKQTYISIEPIEKKEYYDMSSAQVRMYFLQQFDLNNVVYNILQTHMLPGHIDLERLESTFKKLIARHESLRTSFTMKDDKPVQVIHPEVDFKIQYYNNMADFIGPFNLAQAPLLKVGIIILEKEKQILAIDTHHIISDGISQQILAREFMSLYNNETLVPLRIQYKDYAQWQKGSKQRETIQKQENYWLKEFSGDIPVLEFPTDYPRPAIKNFEGKMIYFEIPVRETTSLKGIAIKEEFTLYMKLLSLLTILLSKLSGQEDIVIGTPTAGRGHADLENIIGMFVNTLAMRNYPSGDKTFAYFLEEVKQRVLGAFDNQDYSFEDLVQKVVLNRDAVRNPLFDVMFAFQSQAENAGQRPEQAFTNDVPAPGNTEVYKKVSRFDMSWAAIETGNSLVFGIEYCTKLFKEETIYRFIRYFKQIITVVIEFPGIAISAIEILPEEERKQILIDFNNTTTLYPKDKSIQQLFAEQSEERPDHIAVIMTNSEDKVNDGDRRMALTYKKLNHSSGYLAKLLQEKGLKPGQIAGILMERSTQMIMAMLAVLKSGCTYLPLDLKLPGERVKYILKDSNAAILVTQQEFLDFQDEGRDGSYEDIVCKPLYPAYIMYTSGSTGKPKGVMIEHQNVARLVKNTNFIQWTREDRLLATGGIAFDISTFEIWGPLLNGGSLFLVEEKTILNAGQLAKIINEEHISILHLVPQLFNQLLFQALEIFIGLKYFLIGGDLVKSNQVNELRVRNFQLELLHMYGPTENTTFSTFLTVNEFYKSTIPIGKPIANSTVYIIDKYNKLIPVGVPGELVVGGDGVARGYLNRPELTAEKFLKKEYRSNRSYRTNIFYKTGDLARWLPDGNIEFMGRIDSQVKIRGQRIEIGEIECQMLKYEGIKEVVVLPKENNDDKFLCAYFVSVKDLDLSGLRGYLAQQLPEYMVPSYFMQMQKLPLTSTGKIDRKMLPAVEIKSSEKYSPPNSENEQILCQIWSEILGIEKEKIGIDDNFFEIGGNSLNLIRLVGKIDKVLGIQMPIPQVYHNSTIRLIARALMSKSFNEQDVVLLNRAKPRKIFCFPDQIGLGYGYGSMASILDDYSVYAFSFIEEENRLSRYIELIKSIQPFGPYVFFGHSAAGRLTLQLTKAFENQGGDVTDIIFCDCLFTGNMTLDIERETIMLEPMLDEFLKNWSAEFLKDKVLKKAVSHMTYLNTVTGLEKINANIHLILSEETRHKQIDPQCWEKLTYKTSQVYEGWGRHVDMLWGVDLEKNIKIIKNILKEIYHE